ncbi:MAG: HAMP domain-containing sensor histidine kinase [Eubacteriales bacterium]|nr:HAMP domain-containing sensor histidine kinase [Eubacteriales bacterium]
MDRESKLPHAANDAAKRRRRSSSGKRRGLSIRWKMFFSLVAFIAFALLVVWLFQIKLLGYFYQSIRERELTRLADVIENCIDDENRDSVVYAYAVDSKVCVRLMRIETAGDKVMAYEELSVDVAEDCVLHNITNTYLSRLYYAAMTNGEYTDKMTRQQLYDSGYFYPRYSLSDQHGRPDGAKGAIQSMIYVRMITNSAGERFAIMLNTEITPVGSLVSMMTTQYIWVVEVLLVGALLLAIVLSRIISTPIERMNETAKQLAEGHYDVHFGGDGFREARELAETLNYAASELSKTDRLQKELIANISHDLRTPLTMITGYGEVMRDVPGENTPENVQVIIDEANRLSELVSSLLDLSRLQAGAGKPNIARFDLTGTVRDAMNRYAKLTEHYGYRIEFYSHGSVEVEADRSMILQVLYNLINNAINYIGDDKRVMVTQEVHDGVVRISVADHGEGIDPEHLPLIWDRYYKENKVHRRATVGTGIGLSIVKGVLEAHGAGYGVDSTPGEGSCFWFELKVAPLDGNVDNNAGGVPDALPDMQPVTQNDVRPDPDVAGAGQSDPEQSDDGKSGHSMQ